MRLTECIELGNQLKDIYTKLGIANNRSGGISIGGEGVIAPCNSLEEFKDFCMKIRNTQVREFLLKNYKQFDFTWEREEDSYEGVYVHTNSACIETEIYGQPYPVRISLQLEL